MKPYSTRGKYLEGMFIGINIMRRGMSGIYMYYIYEIYIYNINDYLDVYIYI